MGLLRIPGTTNGQCTNKKKNSKPMLSFTAVLMLACCITICSFLATVVEGTSLYSSQLINTAPGTRVNNLVYHPADREFYVATNLGTLAYEWYLPKIRVGGTGGLPSPYYAFRNVSDLSSFVAYDLAVTDDHILYVAGLDGLKIFNISGGVSAVVELNYILAGRSICAVGTHDDLLVLSMTDSTSGTKPSCSSDGAGYIQLFDISDRKSPVGAGSLTKEVQKILSIQVTATNIFVMGQRNFHVLHRDNSLPTALSQVPTFHCGSNGTTDSSFRISGDVAYLTCGYNPVFVVNISHVRSASALASQKTFEYIVRGFLYDFLEDTCLVGGTPIVMGWYGTVAAMDFDIQQQEYSISTYLPLRTRDCYRCITYGKTMYLGCDQGIAIADYNNVLSTGSLLSSGGGQDGMYYQSTKNRLWAVEHYDSVSKSSIRVHTLSSTGSATAYNYFYVDKPYVAVSETQAYRMTIASRSMYTHYNTSLDGAWVQHVSKTFSSFIGLPACAMGSHGEYLVMARIKTSYSCATQWNLHVFKFTQSNFTIIQVIQSSTMSFVGTVHITVDYIGLINRYIFMSIPARNSFAMMNLPTTAEETVAMKWNYTGCLERPGKFTKKGNTIYLVCENEGIHVLDVSLVTSVSLQDKYTHSLYWVDNLCASDKYLFLPQTDGNTLYMTSFDLTTKGIEETIQVESTTNYDCTGGCVAFSDSLAFVGCDRVMQLKRTEPTTKTCKLYYDSLVYPRHDYCAPDCFATFRQCAGWSPNITELQSAVVLGGDCQQTQSCINGLVRCLNNESYTSPCLNSWLNWSIHWEIERNGKLYNDSSVYYSCLDLSCYLLNLAFPEGDCTADKSITCQPTTTFYARMTFTDLNFTTLVESSTLRTKFVNYMEQDLFNWLQITGIRVENISATSGITWTNPKKTRRRAADPHGGLDVVWSAPGVTLTNTAFNAQYDKFSWKTADEWMFLTTADADFTDIWHEDTFAYDWKSAPTYTKAPPLAPGETYEPTTPAPTPLPPGQTYEPTPSPSSGKTIVGLKEQTFIIIVSAGGGGLLFLIIILILCCVYCGRKKYRIEERKSTPSEASLPFPEVVSHVDEELSEAVNAMLKDVQGGAPEVNVIEKANRARILALSFHPQRPEGPFIVTLNALTSQMTAFFHPRTSREMSLLLATLSIHVSAKCLTNNIALDIDEKNRWLDDLEKVRRLLCRGEEKTSQSGYHTNGLDFSLDVVQECIHSTESYINVSKGHELTRVFSAALQAFHGDYGELVSLCTESYSLAGRSQKGWFNQVIRYSVVSPQDGAQHNLVKLLVKEVPVENWHAMYQWLLLMDAVVDCGDDELQQLALDAIQESKLLRHNSWRVREKTAETVSHLTRYGMTQFAAVEMLTDFRLVEEDKRVLFTLHHADGEKKIQALLKQHRQVAEDYATKVIEQQRETLKLNAESLKARMHPTSQDGGCLDSDLQSHLIRSENDATLLQAMKENGAHLFDDLGLSSPTSWKTGERRSSTDPGHLVRTTSSVIIGELASLRDAMTNLSASMIVSGTTHDDTETCGKISQTFLRIEARCSQNTGVVAAVPQMKALCGALKEPIDELLADYNRPGHRYFMILSDVLTSLITLEGLVHDEDELAVRLQLSLKDVQDRLVLSFDKLCIHFDVVSAQPTIDIDVSEVAEIPIESIEIASGIGAVLGSGGFGTVMRGRYQGKDIAVKVIRDITSSIKAAALSEAKLQSRLCHPHIVALYGISYHQDQLSLVMELCTGGGLTKVIFDTEKQLTYSEKARYTQQLASAMCYLHCSTKNPESGESTKILHGDLKPNNIMLDARGNLKLTDFGHSAMRTSSMSYGTSAGSHRRGTLGYQSPESFRGEKLTTRSDVFSYGVVVYELWTRKKAFESEKAVEEAMKTKKMPSLDPIKHLTVRSLVAKCWEENPKDRPSFSEIVALLEELE